MQTTFPNGTIFFTTDGSSPDFTSRFYNGPVTFRHPVTIRALAYDANFVQNWETDPVEVNILPTYKLTATSRGGGSIAVSPPGPYLSNTTVTVSAAPAPGWTFLQWLGDVNSSSPTNALVMDHDSSVEAVFGTSLGTSVSGSGSILMGAVAPFYPFGYVATLAAVPQPGNYFALWGNAASGTNNPLRFTITNANPTVSCLFGSLSAGQVALIVVPDGEGQVTTAPRGNRFNNGQIVTLSAAPERTNPNRPATIARQVRRRSGVLQSRKLGSKANSSESACQRTTPIQRRPANPPRRAGSSRTE
jgi:hypothetical protein